MEGADNVVSCQNYTTVSVAILIEIECCSQSTIDVLVTHFTQTNCNVLLVSNLLPINFPFDVRQQMRVVLLVLTMSTMYDNKSLANDTSGLRGSD